MHRTLLILFSLMGLILVDFSQAATPQKSHKTLPPEMTAQDQGTTREDLELTRQIRTALNQDSSLSVRAHNVVVITRKGQVFLNGVVSTQQERMRVEAIAKQFAGKQKVKNETVVKE